MSTKIYNAFKGEHIKTTQQVAAYLARLRAFKKRLMWAACDEIERSIDLEKGSHEAQDKVKKAMRSGLRDSLNFSSSAVIFMHPRIEGIIVQFFGIEDAPFREIKPPTHGLKDWHFQNQCDHDEKISEKEWRQREREWDMFHKLAFTPMDQGLTFPFIEESHIWQLFSMIGQRRRGEV